MLSEKIKLKNGLETLFIDCPGSAASVQFWFRAGSALESKEDQGIAHFLEHMFFKGTKKRPGVMIAKEVESFGGEINAFTSFDYTCYYINSPKAHLADSINILMDMVSNPLFSQEELIPERDVVFEEYRRSFDSPHQFHFTHIQKQAFSSGYNHQILGTPKSIKSFTREQLYRFRNDYYNLNNSMLIVAGEIPNKSKIINTIEKYQMPHGKESKFPKFKVKPKGSISIYNKEVRQATLSLTINAPNDMNSNAPSEDLAINVLSHGQMSFLYKELVTNTSLATSVSGSTMFFNNGGAHFLKITFPVANTEKIFQQLTQSLKKLNRKDFSNNDIARIKNQYVASKVYEKESLEAYSFSLGHSFAQNGDLTWDDEFVKRIKSVSSSQVNSSIKDIFNKDIHFTLQLPKEVLKNTFKPQLEKLKSDLSVVFTKASVMKGDKNIEFSKFDSEVRVKTLKKGVKLVYRKSTLTPTFVFHSYIKGGLSYETTNDNGVFNLISRIVNYGPKGVEFEKFKNDLDLMSASLHGFSGKNAYGLTMHGQTTHFDKLLKYYIDTLKNPAIRSNDLKLEKQLMLRSLENQQEDPVKQCFKKVNEVFFDQHSYSQGVIGSEKNIAKMTKRQLLKTHLKHLQYEQLVFTYCGDLEMDEVIESITPYMTDLKSRSAKTVRNQKAKVLKDKKFFIPMEREQTHLFIGRPGYKVSHRDDLFLKMLTSYLSGQSSDLFVEVRDKKGLCYAIQPVHHTALEAGYWGIYIGTGSEKKDQAIVSILGILDKIKKRGFSQSEFVRIKKMIEGQNQLNLQTIDDYANYYSIAILHELGIDYQSLSFERIKNFELNEFNDFVKRFLDYKWKIIEVGPANN